MILTIKQEKALREAFEREKNYFTLFENYRRNYKLRPITAKFYSKHEGFAPVGEYKVTVEEINQHISAGPKERHRRPETTNHEYGWYSEPLLKINVKDRRLSHPRMGHDFIRHSLQVQKDNRTKEKFIGVPFLLQ